MCTQILGMWWQLPSITVCVCLVAPYVACRPGDGATSVSSVSLWLCAAHSVTSTYQWLSLNLCKLQSWRSGTAHWFPNLLQGGNRMDWSKFCIYIYIFFFSPPKTQTVIICTLKPKYIISLSILSDQDASFLISHESAIEFILYSRSSAT